MIVNISHNKETIIRIKSFSCDVLSFLICKGSHPAFKEDTKDLRRIMKDVMA
jgi:hypothetical protein